MSLYEDLKAAGIALDHHESDLYALATPASRALIKKHGAKAETFKSDVDGLIWFDIPFAYTPFWDKAAARGKGKAGK